MVEKLSQEIYEEALNFLNSLPEKKVDIIVNLFNSTPANSKVRKNLAKTLGIPKMNRIAFCSQDKVQRITVGFVAKAAGLKNIGQFSNEKEALNWL